MHLSLALLENPVNRAFAWSDVIPVLFALGVMATFLIIAFLAMRKHPAGLKPLFMTEMWERFSYYGMRALLSLYMVGRIQDGGLGFSDATATQIYGTYGMAIYLMSLPGGWIADRFLGYRRTTTLGGIILALGHLALAFHPLPFFFGGMALIVIGTGMLKTSCTSMVGMLYDKNDERRDAGYSLYYMGINLGAFIAPIICGFIAQSGTFLWLTDRIGMSSSVGWHWGFAAAGVAMTFGLVQFKLQQHKLGEVGLSRGETAKIAENRGETESSAPLEEARQHRLKAMIVFALFGCVILSFALYGLLPLLWVTPIAILLGAAFGYSNWNYVVLTGEEKKRLGAIAVLFVFSMIFWAIFEQAGTTLSFYADRHTSRFLPGSAQPFPSTWYQSVNSIFVISLAPLFSILWTRLGKRNPSSPIKFAIGVICAGLGFLLLVPTMGTIKLGGLAGPWWLVGTYFIHTIGEICLYPVGMSTTSRLAPAKFTGLMMGVWLLSISFGYKLGGFAGHLVDQYSLGTFLLGCFAITAVATLVLLALTPTIKRLMGDAPAESAGH
jgi:proton-dependent oligopeptide transporter, POT family